MDEDPHHFRIAGGALDEAGVGVGPGFDIDR
jgi:hypothetical protein